MYFLSRKSQLKYRLYEKVAKLSALRSDIDIHLNPDLNQSVVMIQEVAASNIKKYSCCEIRDPFIKERSLYDTH